MRISHSVIIKEELKEDNTNCLTTGSELALSRVFNLECAVHWKTIAAESGLARGWIGSTCSGF